MNIEDAIIKATQRATEGVTLSDPNLEDCPIVYANEAFCSLTGYSIDEIIGKNCRFLQGDSTEMQEVGKISKTIQACEKGVFILLNYRKDGTPFWNRLSLSPIFNTAGELKYYAGIQTDVTSLKQTTRSFDQYRQEIQNGLEENSHILNSLLADLKQGTVQPAHLVESLLSIKEQLLVLRTINQEQSTDILEYVNIR